MYIVHINSKHNTYFSDGFPRNIVSKSTSFVMTHGVELSDTLIITNYY